MFPNLRLLFLRFFIVVQEINYPSCFIVYYEIKQRKKATRFVIPSIILQTQPFPSEFGESPFARIRPLSILPRTTRKKSLARSEKVYTQWVGVDGIWILSQITQNPFQLARNTHIVLRTYSKSVVIGYSGRKLPWKLLAIIYKGKPLLRSPFVCSC